MNHSRQKIYGVMAEFDTPERLLAATRSSYAAGYRRMDAYSPFPIDGLAEALGFLNTHVSLLVLAGGVFGAVAGFALQYFCSVIAYPLNIGGKPLNSWPAFIPIVFETTVLCASLCAGIGMFFLNGLPQPYHPAFNVPRFALASRDRFFLLIDARDSRFDVDKVTQFMSGLNASEISQVQS